MKTLKQQMIPIIFILLSFLLVSCELQEVKLINNPVCELPCWNGVEMDMSVDEVKARLKEIPEIQYGSMMAYETPERELDTTIVAYFLKQNFEGVSFYFSDNQLKRMVFRKPNGSAKELGYWITGLEEPSSVILYGGRMNHGLLMLSTYFEEFPVCLNSEYTRQDETFDINELTNITDVTVFDPKFNNDSFYKSCFSADFQEYRQNWIGYGTYKIFP